MIILVPPYINNIINNVRDVVSGVETKRERAGTRDGKTGQGQNLGPTEARFS